MKLNCKASGGEISATIPLKAILRGVNMIHFNYKNKEYILFFYPCGFMASVTQEETGRVREFKYDKSTKIIDFLAILDKVQF